MDAASRRPSPASQRDAKSGGCTTYSVQRSRQLQGTDAQLTGPVGAAEALEAQEVLVLGIDCPMILRSGF